MRQSLAVRVSRWSSAYPARLDAAVAGVFAAAFVPAGAWLAGWSGLLLSAALAAPLAVRRRFPVAVAAWVAGVSLVQLTLLRIPLPADLAVPVVVHTVAAYVPSRAVRLSVLAAAVGGGVAGGFRWSTPPAYRANAIAAAAVLAVLAALVWVVGNLVRGREANLRELAAARRQRERVAAAREIHDIVAHSLAVVIVQADGGRYAGGAHSAEALETIGRTARSALAEVRGLIDLLRDEPVRPGGASLERLVAAVRATGLPVRVDAGRAALDGLPAPVCTAVLRTVQEALTNVLKHAGPEATAEVTVARTPAAVTVRVANRGATGGFSGGHSGNGHSGGGHSGGGHSGGGHSGGGHPGGGHPGGGLSGGGLSGGGTGLGLTGMRERVAELGGTLTAGPQPGGFLVEASIPGPP